MLACKDPAMDTATMAHPHLAEVCGDSESEARVTNEEEEEEEEAMSDLDRDLLDDELLADAGIESRAESFFGPWGGQGSAQVTTDGSCESDEELRSSHSSGLLRSAPSSPRRAGLRERRAKTEPSARFERAEARPAARGRSAKGAGRRKVSKGPGRLPAPKPATRALATGKRQSGVAIVGRGKRLRVTLKGEAYGYQRGLDDSTSEESVAGDEEPPLANPRGAPRPPPAKGGGGRGHRGGGVQSLPEVAEYRCSCCGDDYTKRSHHNPWWALVQHECPKCGKVQFPSINISAPANQISYLAPDGAAARAASGATAASSLAAAAAAPDGGDHDDSDDGADDDDDEPHLHLDAVASMVPDLPEFGLDVSEAPPVDDFHSAGASDADDEASGETASPPPAGGADARAATPPVKAEPAAA